MSGSFSQGGYTITQTPTGVTIQEDDSKTISIALPVYSAVEDFNASSFHGYAVTYPVGLVAVLSEDTIYNNLLRDPGPLDERLSSPVTNGQTVTLAGNPFGNNINNITTYVDSSDEIVVNVTQPGHIFDPGAVIRYLHQEDGFWVITSIGVGNDAATANENQELAPLIWLTNTLQIAYYSASDTLDKEVSHLVSAVATAFGCPHFTTYDGLHFDFQGAGEFIAARSTVPGNMFQVQMRIEPEGSVDSAVSIITQIAVQVGKDRITFGVPQGSDAPRPQVVLVNGAATTISQTNPVLTLDGGTVTRVSSNEYRVALNTGEVVTVNPFGDGMGYSIALAPTDIPGSVQGFLGPDEGQANDFQLPDGTVLQQPLTQAQLYQQFANAWRVTDANSLFDYAPGQSTATFTDTMYPREILTLADFSPDLVAKAAALAAAAGITDPTLAADAEFDYLTMGNSNYFLEDATVAARNSTVPTPASITQPAAPPPSIGLLPVDPAIEEAAGATTPVTFIVNLTSAATTDTVVNYNVVSPTRLISGKTFFTAADFGGTLPSGSVTIVAGQTQGTVTVNVPNSAIGAAPDKWLLVAASSPGGNLVYNPTAQTDIINPQPSAPTGFDGDLVTVSVYYPDQIPADLLLTGTATVVPGVTTFPNILALSAPNAPPTGVTILGPSVDFSGSDIIINYPAEEEGVTLATSPFNGAVFQTDLSDPAITGVAIKSTNIGGLTASDLSFTGHSISLNESGLTLPTNAPATIDLAATFATAPTPAAIGLNGDIVRLDGYSPSIAPENLIATGTATVVPGTVTFPDEAALSTENPSATRIVGESVAISGDTIQFLYPTSEEGTTFRSGSFNGEVITDLTPGAAIITGLTLDSTNIPGLTRDDFSFTDHSIAYNVQGLSLPSNVPAATKISLQFAGLPSEINPLLMPSS